MDAPLTCSQIATARQEPLIGTAPRVDTWFLLVHLAPWGGKALQDSKLPSEVKSHLESLLSASPFSRLLLIKKEAPARDAPVIFYVAHGAGTNARLYAFRLDKPEALADIDVPALLADEGAYPDHRDPEPLFLVCTNGRRDPCCAQHGLPVYRALAALAGKRTWQCSHIGGHRFAANLLLLPEGIYYGGIRPEDAADVLQAGLHGRLLAEKLRGRSSYEAPAQAAEYFLAQEVNPTPWRLVESRDLGPDRWLFEFSSREGGERYRVGLRATTSGELARVSCRSEKLAPVTHYELEFLKML